MKEDRGKLIKFLRHDSGCKCIHYNHYEELADLILERYMVVPKDKIRQVVGVPILSQKKHLYLICVEA